MTYLQIGTHQFSIQYYNIDQKHQRMRRRIPISNQRMLAVSISQHTSGVHNFNSKPNKQRVQIFQSCRIFKNFKTNCIKFVTLQDAKKGKIPIIDHSLILSINITNSQNNQPKFVINRPCLLDQSKEVFLSLRNYSTFYDQIGYKLSQGDIIKVGKKKIKVVYISNRQTEDQQLDDMREYYKSQKSFYFYDSKPEGPCRICLHQQVQQGDFLLTPCECRGSCANVHFNCLKKWVYHKVPSETNGKVQTYYFKNFICQICKSELPKSIYRKKEKFSSEISKLCLFKIRLPTQEPYIILEPENDQKWHILTGRQDENNIHIGRTQSSNIQIRQNSVSRDHAMLKYKKNGFYLVDQYSEFGTYVLLKQTININYSLEMEIGDSLYEFKIERHPQNRI